MNTPKRKPPYIGFITCTRTSNGAKWDNIFYLYDVTTYEAAKAKALELIDTHNKQVLDIKWSLDSIYTICGGVAQ